MNGAKVRTTSNRNIDYGLRLTGIAHSPNHAACIERMGRLEAIRHSDETMRSHM